MDLRTALQYMDSKDVDRANSVVFNRLDSMFKAITDRRKIIGRALAIYLVHKFKFITDVPNASQYYAKVSTLRNILGDKLDNSAYNDLMQMSDDEFIPFAYKALRRVNSPIANELKDLAEQAGMQVEENQNDDKPHYKGFFAKRSITEARLERYNVNGEIEGKEHIYYSTDSLDKAKEVLINLISLPIRGNYFIWDVQEQQEISLDESLKKRDFFPEEAFEKVDVETFIDETYSKDQLKQLIGKVYNQQKIQNIYRRKKYDDKKLFAHTKCTKCGREKRVFLSNLVKNPDKYGSCICSDKNIDGKVDYATKLYTNQKKLRNNTSGYTGVSFVKSYGGQPYNKWRAYIETDGVRTYLGDFTAKTDAVKARKAAGEKGVKWYRQNRNKLMRDVRKKTKKYKTSKYRDSARKTKNKNIKDEK